MKNRHVEETDQGTIMIIYVTTEKTTEEMKFHQAADDHRSSHASHSARCVYVSLHTHTRNHNHTSMTNRRQQDIKP